MARILVLENDVGNAEVIELILREERHEVLNIQCTNLLAGAIDKFLPQLIIMDILLDNADGRVLCNNLKSDSKTSQIPILLITAMMESHALLITSRADCLMLKPFDYSLLTRKVNEMIN
ncbi:response regulator [Pedobacter endophyticus]|uniref:Response regulator n=1 Tax=Pedobacter endophyticus TaxID=2789740 RepID=A0A7U3Q4U3_9SPHI|nr:response regulator [Pedobacter endophyticus]QPH38592.1 response regulator [Pedobacter endophyticus]